ncbi:MAG: DUF1499 domain-containing protein [Desulfuromonadaceae bacterium]
MAARGSWWRFGLLLLLLTGCTASSGELGLTAGVLAPCPPSPNCVCSEDPEAAGYVAPLIFSGEPAAAWTEIQSCINALGGEVRKVEENYLWATFESDLFHFVDDLELRLSAAKQRIQVRSAARVGYWDLGVNADRVEALRKMFAQRER